MWGRDCLCCRTDGGMDWAFDDAGDGYLQPALSGWIGRCARVVKQEIWRKLAVCMMKLIF